MPNNILEKDVIRDGLDDVVDEVFGEVRNDDFNGKKYEAVIESMKIPKSRTTDSVVVVGDNQHDYPVDVQDLVFVRIAYVGNVTRQLW